MRLLWLVLACALLGSCHAALVHRPADADTLLNENSVSFQLDDAMARWPLYDAPSDAPKFMVAVGDINADGRTDYAVPNGAQGEVKIIYGDNTQYSVERTDFQPTDAILLNETFVTLTNVLLPNASDHTFGLSVHAAGDINDDGYDDILIREGHKMSETHGTLYLVYGNPTWGWGESTDIVNTSYTKLTTTNSSTAFINNGAGLTVVADFNGDLIDDVAFGCPGESAGFSDELIGAGEVYIIYGRPSLIAEPELILNDANQAAGSFAIIHGNSTNGHFGVHVTLAGDVDGNMKPDLLVSVDGDEGTMAILITNASHYFPDDNYVTMANLSTSLFRSAATLTLADMPLGDFNGDGIDDFWMADAENREVYIIYGSTDYNLTGEWDLTNVVGVIPAHGVKLTGSVLGDFGVSLTSASGLPCIGMENLGITEEDTSEELLSQGVVCFTNHLNMTAGIDFHNAISTADITGYVIYGRTEGVQYDVLFTDLDDNGIEDYCVYGHDNSSLIICNFEWMAGAVPYVEPEDPVYTTCAPVQVVNDSIAMSTCSDELLLYANCTVWCAPGHAFDVTGPAIGILELECLETADWTGQEALGTLSNLSCIEYDYCSSSPCQNDGTCVPDDSMAQFTCVCGWTDTGTTYGDYCEFFDPCASSPCSSCDMCVGDPLTGIATCVEATFPTIDETGADLSTFGASSGHGVMRSVENATWDMHPVTVTAVGDFNGDGIQDYYTSFLSNDSSAAGYLRIGVNGEATTPSLMSDVSPGVPTGIVIPLWHAALDGLSDTHMVTAVGDVNGDTYDDFILAVPGQGTVYAVYGRVTDTVTDIYIDENDGLGYTTAQYTSAISTNFGKNIVALGDLNSDTLMDYAIVADHTSVIVLGSSFVPADGLHFNFNYTHYGVDVNLLNITNAEVHDINQDSTIMLLWYEDENTTHYPLVPLANFALDAMIDGAAYSTSLPGSAGHVLILDTSFTNVFFMPDIDNNGLGELGWTRSKEPRVEILLDATNILPLATAYVIADLEAAPRVILEARDCADPLLNGCDFGGSVNVLDLNGDSIHDVLISADSGYDSYGVSGASYIFYGADDLSPYLSFDGTTSHLLPDDESAVLVNFGARASTHAVTYTSELIALAQEHAVTFLSLPLDQDVLIYDYCVNIHIDGDDCVIAIEGTNLTEPTCNTGICTDLGLWRYECDCTGTGYEGTNCRMDIDECASTPCQNGGACNHTLGAFTCDCDGTGFIGDRCELDGDDCAATECVYTLASEPNGTAEFVTYCGDGDSFAGNELYLLIDTRDAGTWCQNGGVCTDIGNDFECDCTGTGFEGDLCETDIDDCVIYIDDSSSYSASSSSYYYVDTTTSDTGVGTSVGVTGTPTTGTSAGTSSAGTSSSAAASSPAATGATSSVAATGATSSVAATGGSSSAAASSSTVAASSAATSAASSTAAATSAATSAAASSTTAPASSAPASSSSSGSRRRLLQATTQPRCQNSGVCTDLGANAYVCACPDGFTGVDCEEPINDGNATETDLCTPNPCANGVCSLVDANADSSDPSSSSFSSAYSASSASSGSSDSSSSDVVLTPTCTCDAGWSGNLCTLPTGIDCGNNSMVLIQVDFTGYDETTYATFEDFQTALPSLLAEAARSENGGSGVDDSEFQFSEQVEFAIVTEQADGSGSSTSGPVISSYSVYFDVVQTSSSTMCPEQVVALLEQSINDITSEINTIIFNANVQTVTTDPAEEDDEIPPTKEPFDITIVLIIVGVLIAVGGGGYYMSTRKGNATVAPVGGAAGGPGGKYGAPPGGKSGKRRGGGSSSDSSSSGSSSQSSSESSEPPTPSSSSEPSESSTDSEEERRRRKKARGRGKKKGRRRR